MEVVEAAEAVEAAVRRTQEQQSTRHTVGKSIVVGAVGAVGPESHSHMDTETC